eukprot:2166201-Amphidinium_carterae.1
MLPERAARDVLMSAAVRFSMFDGHSFTSNQNYRVLQTWTRTFDRGSGLLKFILQPDNVVYAYRRRKTLTANSISKLRSQWCCYSIHTWMKAEF